MLSANHEPCVQQGRGTVQGGGGVAALFPPQAEFGRASEQELRESAFHLLTETGFSHMPSSHSPKEGVVFRSLP